MYLCWLPDYAVSATANRYDGRAILGGDLEHVAEDVVLYVVSTVSRHRREIRVLASGSCSHVAHISLYELLSLVRMHVSNKLCICLNLHVCMNLSMHIYIYIDEI